MQMIADETGLKQLIYMVLGWRISLTHRRGVAHRLCLTFISDYDNDMAIHVYVHNIHKDAWLLTQKQCVTYCKGMTFCLRHLLHL